MGRWTQARRRMWRDHEEKMKPEWIAKTTWKTSQKIVGMSVEHRDYKCWDDTKTGLCPNTKRKGRKVWFTFYTNLSFFIIGEYDNNQKGKLTIFFYLSKYFNSWKFLENKVNSFAAHVCRVHKLVQYELAE